MVSVQLKKTNQSNFNNNNDDDGEDDDEHKYLSRFIARWCYEQQMRCEIGDNYLKLIVNGIDEALTKAKSDRSTKHALLIELAKNGINSLQTPADKLTLVDQCNDNDDNDDDDDDDCVLPDRLQAVYVLDPQHAPPSHRRCLYDHTATRFGSRLLVVGGRDIPNTFDALKLDPELQYSDIRGSNHASIRCLNLLQQKVCVLFAAFSDMLTVCLLTCLVGELARWCQSKLANRENQRLQRPNGANTYRLASMRSRGAARRSSALRRRRPLDQQRNAFALRQL
jgi:hypothetical protein